MSGNRQELPPVESLEVAQDEALRVRNIAQAYAQCLVTGELALAQVLYGGRGPLGPKPSVTGR